MRRVQRGFGATLVLVTATGLVFVACSGNDLDFRANPDAGGSGGAVAGSAGKSGGSGGSMSKGGAGGSGGSTSKGGSAGTDSGGEGGADSGGTHAGGEGGADMGGSNAGGEAGSDVGGNGGSAGTAGTNNAGGSAGSAGNGGTGGNAGNGGSAGSGGACEPVDWFPDSDGDDFGRTSSKLTQCTAPGDAWKLVGGDCNDDNADVNSDHTEYEKVTYMAPGGNDSYDWNCSGTEQSDPSQMGAAPTCPATSVNCANRTPGYVPTGRSGPGVNPLCGSTTIRSCVVVNAIGCEPMLVMISEPHRCR